MKTTRLICIYYRNDEIAYTQKNNRSSSYLWQLPQRIRHINRYITNVAKNVAQTNLYNASYC